MLAEDRASSALALAGNEEDSGEGEGGAKADTERVRACSRDRPGGAGASWKEDLKGEVGDCGGSG